MKKRILACFLAALMAAGTIPFAFAQGYDLGDVDRDNSISSSDARLALRASVGLEELDEEQKKLADADFDDSISSADARLILRASVGLEELKNPHTHSYTIEEITTPATCTEAGEKKLSCECGEFITEAVAATGHTEVLDEESAKPVTCKEDGFTGNTVCSSCGTLIKEGEVLVSDGTQHDMVETTVAPTCTQQGYQVVKCKYCDKYDPESLKYTAEPTNHTWDEGVITLPTCTEEGFTLRTCIICEAAEKIDLVEANGHDISWEVTKEATCEEEGEKTGKCSVCDYEVTETIALTPCTPVTNIVTGDKNVEGSLCKEVTSCEVCGKVIAENATFAAHVVRNVKIDEATCENPQINHMACKYCTYEYEVIASEGLGHSISPASYKKATCTEDGEIVYSGTCDKCNKTFDETVVVIPHTGHELSGVQTCTTDVICTVCGEVTAPRLGHDYELSTAAYNTEISSFFCSRCGTETSDKLAAFNGIVNSTKTPFFYGSYSASPYIQYADKTSVKTSYTRFDFGIYTSAIKDLYEDEMANTPDEYSPIRRGHILNYLPLSIRNSSEYVVSLLENNDIDNITIEKLTGLSVAEILAGFNPAYTNADQSAKFATFRSLNLDEDIIRVTVDVKDESYESVKNLPADQKTSLGKIYDLDIRNDAAQFTKDANGDLVMEEKESGSGYEIAMKMILKDIRSDAKVTYYFTADTYEPVIAVYDAQILMKQTIDMSFKIGLFSLNGELDPEITTNYTRVYFFPNFFE